MSIIKKSTTVIILSVGLGLLLGLGFNSFSKDNELVHSENSKPIEENSNLANTISIEQPELNTINVEGNYVELGSAEQLFKEAELVIVGTPKEEFLDRVHKVTYSNDQTVEDFYTETVVNVDKIIKAPSDLTIFQNKEFKIIEPAVGIIDNKNGIKSKITTGPYTEMEKDMTYLIFVAKNIYGEYSVKFNTLGKYNIDNKDSKDNDTDKYDVEYETWKDKKVKFKKEFKNKFKL